MDDGEWTTESEEVRWCGWCAAALGSGSKGKKFCNAKCQKRWHAERRRELLARAQAEAIVAEVNAEMGVCPWVRASRGMVNGEW